MTFQSLNENLLFYLISYLFQKPHCGFTLSKHVEISIKSITLLYGSIKKAKE